MSLTITPITTLTYTPPNRANQTQAELAANCSAFATQWKITGNEINTFITEANALAAAVETDAATAATQAAAAAASATEAESYVAQAQAIANYVGEWGDQSGAAAIPYSVSNDGSFYTLIQALANVTTVEPGVTSGWGSYWQRLVFGVGAGGGTLAMPQTLTASTMGARTLTATGYGQSLTMADATGLTAGTCVASWYNSSRFPIPIRNNSGTLIGFVPAGKTVTANLRSTATSDGVWDFLGAIYIAPTISGNLGQYKVYGFENQQVGAIRMSDTHDLVFLNDTVNDYKYCTLVNRSTGVVSAPVLIRSAAINSIFWAIKVEDDKVLFCSCITTAMEAVIITRSGDTPVVNSGNKDTLTLGNNVAGSMDSLTIQKTSNGEFILPWAENSGGGPHIVAITVTGTTPSFGAEVALDGSDTNAFCMDVTGDEIMTLTFTSPNQHYFELFTVSGDTISPVDDLNFTVSAGSSYHSFRKNGIYFEVVSDKIALLISHDGATITNLGTYTLTSSNPRSFMRLADGRLVYNSVSSGTMELNIYKNDAGTDSIATPVSVELITGNDPYLFAEDSDGLVYLTAHATSNPSVTYIFDCSGANPSFVGLQTFQTNDSIEAGSPNTGWPPINRGFIYGASGDLYYYPGYNAKPFFQKLGANGLWESYRTGDALGNNWGFVRNNDNDATEDREGRVYATHDQSAGDAELQLWEAA
jgi:hypothetical protein